MHHPNIINHHSTRILGEIPRGGSRQAESEKKSLLPLLCSDKRSCDI